MPNDPKTYQFDLPTTGRPTDVNLPETWYPGIRDFWSACTTKRSVHPINGIRRLLSTPQPEGTRPEQSRS